MRISLIAAVSPDGVIGKDGALPWRLPADMAFFKRTTMGHHVLMGRRTWDSLPAPLPGRTNVVLTRRPGFEASGAVVKASMPDALRWIEAQGESELFVIGGQRIYEAALPLATRLYLTRVEAGVAGDAFFPPIGGGWTEMSRDTYAADDRHRHPFAICVLERENAPG